MHRCLISFGANIGDARGSVLAAQRMLQQMLHSGDAVQFSRLFQTPPVGGPSGQSSFINAVAAVQTRLNPWEIWHVIRTIEQQMGRQRVRRWEARRIDLDILLFDEVRIWTPQLKIPHPRMCMRRFILQPAADVAADWIDPVSQETVGNLADRLATGRGSLILASPSALQAQTQAILQSKSLPGLQVCDIDALLNVPLALTPEPQSVRRLAATVDTPWLIQRLSQPCNSLDQSNSSRGAVAKLLFFWESASDKGAWEDQHRYLALRLRLAAHESDRDSEFQPLSYVGPRYLLATIDSQWAAHEVAAALDAMDCHVEPIE